MERYALALDRFLAEPVTSAQRVGEIAVLWRLEWWSGDHKIGEPGDPKLERALWKAIEAMSGVVLPVARRTYIDAAVAEAGKRSHIGRMLRKIPFIKPMAPGLAKTPPAGADWIHEVKFDGWRAQIHVEGGSATIYSKNGADYTKRFRALRHTIEGIPLVGRLETSTAH